MQIFLLHCFYLIAFLFAVKIAANIFSKQEKGLKLSKRQGMRKVRSKLSVSFSSFSSRVLPVLWTTPSPIAKEQDQILQPQDTTHNSSSPSPRASALDSAIGQVHSQGRLLAKFRLEIHKECSFCTPDKIGGTREEEPLNEI